MGPWCLELKYVVCGKQKLSCLSRRPDSTGLVSPLLSACFFLFLVAGDGMDGHDLPDPLLRHQAMNQEQRRETEDRQEPRNQAAEGEVTLGRGEGGRDPAEEERVRVVTVGNYILLWD